MFRNLLIATDGSETANLAVERGVAIARETGAAVTLVTAGRPEEGRAVADDVVERYSDSGVQIESVVRAGDAASVILDVSEDRDIDLIVIGNKGMRGAKRFLLSSVPNKVAHHARCGVLIVKTT